jgi:hypothetical protein
MTRDKSRACDENREARVSEPHLPSRMPPLECPAFFSPSTRWFFGIPGVGDAIRSCCPDAHESGGEWRLRRLGFRPPVRGPRHGAAWTPGLGLRSATVAAPLAECRVSPDSGGLTPAAECSASMGTSTVAADDAFAPRREFPGAKHPPRNVARSGASSSGGEGVLDFPLQCALTVYGAPEFAIGRPTSLLGRGAG